MSYQLDSRRSGPVTRSRSRSRGRQVGSPRVFNNFDSFGMQKQQPERTSRRPRRLTKEPDPDYTPIWRRSRSRARNVFTNRQEDSSKPIPATISCGTGVPGVNKNHPVIMDVEKAGASPDTRPRRVPVNQSMMMDCYVELATEGNKRGGTSTKSVSKKRLMEESPPSFDSKKRKSVGPGIAEESRTGSLDQFPTETRRISASCDDQDDGENSSSTLVAVLDLDDVALMGDVKFDDDPVIIEMDCQLNEDTSAKMSREQEPENIQLSGSNNKLSKEKALEGSECVKKKYSFCVIL